MPKPVENRPVPLHLNENTAGCSAAVFAAVQSLTRHDVARYPDYARARAACARYFGVDPDWVLLTNGLDDGLHLAAQTAAVACHRAGRGPGAAVFVEPGFEMYQACADAAGLDTVPVPLGPDFQFPTVALTAAIDARVALVYLNDPHNPTGLPISREAVEHIVERAANATVLLDEAYAEFSGRTAIGPALDRHRHLIVGRTFSKAHGLAGLRVGALVAHPDTLAPIRRAQPPFNVNAVAVRAVEAAAADRAYVEWFVAQAASSRTLIYDFCARRGLTCWPSQANFVLVRVGPGASSVVAALADRGVLVRDRSTQPGCAGCIRLAAGVVEHTTLCLTALEDILAARLD
jgi:histidinol-phosphate aminotransferase